MTRVFVSGGAGFIGSHLVPALLGRPGVEAVTVFDNFTSGSRDRLAGVAGDPRLVVVEGDLKDAAALGAAMKGSDAVIHLAANPDIAKAVSDPDIDYREGTLLARNVWEAARLHGARRVLYTSGSGVYGENPSVRFPESYGPCLPISTYGASKLACEALLCAYAYMFGLHGTALRFANVIGPRQTHGVGLDFVRRLRGEPGRLRILGDGTQRKSYIHVEDVLAAMFLVLERAAAPYDVFNVSTDDDLTVTEIAGLAVEACGLDPATVRFEYTGGDRGWKGDVPVVHFDAGRIRGLGWAPRRTSREAMRDALRAMAAGGPS